MSIFATRLAPLSLAAAVLATLAAGSTGCSTEAFCFANCGDTTTTTSASSSAGSGGSTGSAGGGGSGGGCGFLGCSTSTGNGGGGGCMKTNSGVEICDHIDNDCNGIVDDVPASTLQTDVLNCGACFNNCNTIPDANWLSSSIACAAGKCSGTCAQDYYNLNDTDMLGTCEYYCVKVSNTDTTCDGVDDDCNGLIDDGVDICTSVDNCGACGRACSLPHAVPKCLHTGAASCDPTNTQCLIDTSVNTPGAVLNGCDCVDASNCWWDLDNSAATGCEYPCFKTDGGAGLGVEVCGDGVDNDCNGLIDEADPNVVSDDPTKPLGGTCFGGTMGLCATAAHAGTWACMAHQVVCTGANVLHPGDLQETCNGVDDDCDGVIDNSPTDAGGACQGAVNFPCHPGVNTCMSGTIVCVGPVNPTPEVCDGIDNDCNGTIDDGIASVDCDLPAHPVPNGSNFTQPCHKGMTTCTGGATQCAGSIVYPPIAGHSSTGTAATDACGVDSNCDGVLTNQPDLTSDVHNCGTCGNDCTAGAVHANFACMNSQCVFQGCAVGYYDNGAAATPGIPGSDAVAGDHKCGYGPCNASPETCNGLDDDCNGVIDDNPAQPSIAQVCHVSVGNTFAECQLYDGATNPGGVSIACTAGAWVCAFHTANVCNPTCQAASEICDGLDNNCNGVRNENVPTYGQPCASDDGLPPPGDGACRTTGTYICNGLNATKCSATKNLALAGPEICDGIDNDCDGLVDENFTSPGTNGQYFVKPNVTKIEVSQVPLVYAWMYSYEASRPSATTAAAGSGDGYWCNSASCPGGTASAPTGVTLDKTPACSVQGKIPWFNVSPVEADQTCYNMGGHLCTTAEWQAACITRPPGTSTCKWGYAPNGTACTTALGGTLGVASYPVPFPTTGANFCNLGPTYDFNPATTTVEENGLLVTGSPSLKNCFADWTSLLSDGAATGKIFDMTGNLREITKDTTATPVDYPLMGGSFDTQDEAGATCQFKFYTVAQDFQLYDLGYRCCFSVDPTGSCTNGIKDGSETGIDCGGSLGLGTANSGCAKCAAGQTCAISTDCISNVCNGLHKCN